MPDVVGFAGPFRLGHIGRTPGSRRAAILADFQIFKDDLKRVRKYPRRSPEVWLEDRYEDIFIDPIALLGAEAPRLDLGMEPEADEHPHEYMAEGSAGGKFADELGRLTVPGGSAEGDRIILSTVAVSQDVRVGLKHFPNAHQAAIDLANSLFDFLWFHLDREGHEKAIVPTLLRTGFDASLIETKWEIAKNVILDWFNRHPVSGFSELVARIQRERALCGEQPPPKVAANKRSRPPTVNERMGGAIFESPEAVGWNSTQWAKYLKCAKSTVVETAVWKALENARLQAKAKLMKDRRRKPKASDRRND